MYTMYGGKPERDQKKCAAKVLTAGKQSVTG
jgi:hypothetical protein